MTDLTVSQQFVFEAIQDYWQEKGRSPAVKDLAEMLGCSLNNINEHLIVLERKGVIDKRYGVTRGISPTGLKAHIKLFFVSHETCQNEQAICSE